MNESDPYTGIVRNWDSVENQMNIILADISSNPSDWESNHITTAGWSPAGNENPDPNSGYSVNVPNPPGTDPTTARNHFILYLLSDVQTPTLHTSAIGSYRINATVDTIDVAGCTAKVRFWMSNTMNQASFGQFANDFPFTLFDMEPQVMWWEWTEEIRFNSSAGTYEVINNSSGWE